MPGLIHNIVRRSRDTKMTLSPRNVGIFAPLQTPLTDFSPTIETKPAKKTEPPSAPVPLKALPPEPSQLTTRPAPTNQRFDQKQIAHLEAQQHNEQFTFPEDPTHSNISEEPQAPKQFTPSNHEPAATEPPPSVIQSDTPFASLPSERKSDDPALQLRETILTQNTAPPAPSSEVAELDAKLDSLLKRIEQTDTPPKIVKEATLQPESPRPKSLASNEAPTRSSTTLNSKRASTPTRQASRPMPQLKVEPPKPSVQISIGRIEFVEAPSPAPAPPASAPKPHRPKPPTPNVTLSEYLKS